MKILFFHGLESNLPSSKVEWMEKQAHDVLAHAMKYEQADAFRRALAVARKFQPDLIVGSSMGGYFAVLVGSHIPTRLVLLNPALSGRSIEYDHPENGSFHPDVWALLGKNDTLIDPKDSAQILRKMNARLCLGDHGHRTPLLVFTEYMEKVFAEIG